MLDLYLPHHSHTQRDCFSGKEGGLWDPTLSSSSRIRPPTKEDGPRPTAVAKGDEDDEGRSSLPVGPTTGRRWGCGDGRYCTVRTRVVR